MSSLIDLPEEIIIIIIKQLDIKSVYNLYKTCGLLKNIVVMPGVIRKCNLSCNTMSTPRSLQVDMIKQISGHLYELNMCGVSNLRKSMLLPAITRMKCLKTLDVSYTEISIFDMIDLYTNCPTIKNITINLPEILKLTEKTLLELQEVFKNFVNVHFVTKLGLLKVPLQILRNSALDTLKFTLSGTGGILQCDEIHNLHSFKHFCMFMVNYGLDARQGYGNELLPIVKMDNIEYIILEYTGKYSIYTSPFFKKFFSENFKILSFASFDANCNTRCQNIAIFTWNNKTTIFDELFFAYLKKRMKEILACELTVSSDRVLPLGIDTHCYEWFHLHAIDAVSQRNKSIGMEPFFKKRRIVRTDHILDYNQIFSDHKTIKLSIYISHSINVNLSSNSEYLRKLTYLSLAGTIVRYSSEFFNILFRCCKKLITLNVEASALSPCGPAIMRSVPLSQSLKNIRLLDKRVDFRTLFSSFTQCKSLENICIIDNSCDVNELADLAALYQCVNLYSLYIRATMTKSTLTKMNSMHKSLLKKKPEHYINFSIECPNTIRHVDYNPYLHVFNLKPIKPV